MEVEIRVSASQVNKIHITWNHFNHFRVVFSTFTMLCIYYHCLILAHLHHPPKKPCTHLPSSRPLLTSNPLSVSMGLPVLDMPCKWSHTVCSLLCLTSVLRICNCEGKAEAGAWEWGRVGEGKLCPVLMGAPSQRWQQLGHRFLVEPVPFLDLDREGYCFWLNLFGSWGLESK